MKIKLAFFSLFALICSVAFYAATPLAVDSTVEEKTPSAATFLLLGVDSAASNSDVVVLARYDTDKNQVVLMQLPRDMYIEGEEASPKLNHIYAVCRANGMNEKEALEYTRSRLSAALSVPIHGALCLDLSTFSSIVDAVGGIPITVPFDMTYSDPAQGLSIMLKKGETVLDGKTAEQFVRYRSGYTEGDIGRLDAQKLFFAAALDHITKKISVPEALALALRFSDDISFSGEKEAFLPLIGALLRDRTSLSIYFLSIPGEAIEADRTWYYVINREAVCEVLNRFYTPNEHLNRDTFDKEGRFYKESDQFLNIYFSAGMPYRVYTAEDITDINILKKD